MLKLPMLLGTTVVVALILVSASASEVPSLCRQSGYFALVDNTPEFYTCRASPAGGFSLQFLRCSSGAVFSSKAGQCTEVTDLSRLAREDGNIENPTIPPDNLDDSTSTSVKPVEVTTEAPIPTKEAAGETSEDPEEATTDEPSTDEPSTDEPTTDEPSTDEPSTDEPSTDEPSTDEPSSDGPSTDDPSTDEPSSDTTEEPADKTTDDASTDDPTTDDPSTDDSTTDDGTGTTSTDDGTSATEVLNCPSTGFFPKDDNCNEFVLCYDDGSDLHSSVFKCPGDMQFDPKTSFCSLEFDCASV
ncbi:salivary glue protein Sgs-3 isoform X1 [Drosophila subobscura]|uniref:salivary glue protein Sgs-3 isoform X1 n=1 Tax=Drosophila subobscura TaxID=7241 RepID=UPI00155AE0DE|nr:salivary glue protein Sgs-3 isoform X1 [Drosophila subobscura]